METFDHMLRFVRDTSAGITLGVVQIVILVAIIRRVVRYDQARRNQSTDQDRADMQAAARRYDKE